MTDATLAQRVSAAVPTVSELARDALIEGLGRMKGPDAGRLLATLATGSIADRRKVAEALAGHPEVSTVLVGLADDPDPGVRANAVSAWARSGRPMRRIWWRPFATTSSRVAGNAAAAMGRLAARGANVQKTRGALCSALTDLRPYVRANALEGLSVAALSCRADSTRMLFAGDSSDSVRLAAADFMARAIARADTSPDAADVRALARCVGRGQGLGLAARCAHPLPVATGVEDVAVYVVPDGRNLPQPQPPIPFYERMGFSVWGSPTEGARSSSGRRLPEYFDSQCRLRWRGDLRIPRFEPPAQAVSEGGVFLRGVTGRGPEGLSALDGNWTSREDLSVDVAAYRLRCPDPSCPAKHVAEALLDSALRLV